MILKTPLQNLAQDSPLDLDLILKTPLQDLAKDSSLALAQMMTTMDFKIIWVPFQNFSVSLDPLGSDWAFELGLTGAWGWAWGVWGQRSWDLGLTKTDTF